MNWLLHWLAVHTGTVNESGPYYGFWSGFGSDLGEVALIGALITGFKHVNCHVKGCPRIGHYTVEGTPYKVCRKHHPEMDDKAPTVEQVHAAHQAAKELHDHIESATAPKKEIP